MITETVAFAWPWALALALLAPLIAWWPRRRRARAAVAFSDIRLVEPAGATIRQRLLWLPPLLRALAFVCLAVALARPQAGIGEVRTSVQGVAMILVVDRSLSMQLPMQYRGSAASRLDVVKSVLRDFVHGDGRALPGRKNDLMGLVVFAGFADTLAPLTRSHEVVTTFVDNIDLATSQVEGGTAVGDGIALAAARLMRAEEELKRRARDDDAPDFEIKSKVIVLLTDGDENRGEMRAPRAAELAREWGIRVYTIGVGDESGGLIRNRGQILTIPRGTGFDERVLRLIADRTGGRYWRATDGEALRRVYEEIDRLEKSDIISTEFTSYEEAFMPWAAAALAALALELLLTLTVLRRAPA